MVTASVLTFPRPAPSANTCARCRVQPEGICTAMGETAFAAVQAAVRRVSLASNQSLLAGGATRTSVWLVRSGLLRVQSIDAEGRRQIVGLLLPGEFIGDDLTSRPAYSIEAATPAEVCRMDRRAFEALLLQDPGLRRAVLRRRLAKLDQLQWLTWTLGALRLEERVCAFLLYATRIMPFAPRPEGDGILSIELPRADIADLMGTTLESLSRVTHKLHKRGVIEILDPTHFRLPDLGALVAASGMRDLDEVPACGAIAVTRALAQPQPLSLPA